MPLVGWSSTVRGPSAAGGHMRSARLLLIAVAASLAVLALAGARLEPAKAVSTDLFVSEYIEGSSNNKALEIFNGTGSTVDLADSGYQVRMYFNGSQAAGLTINLTGSVAPGDVFVLAQSAADPPILAQADQTNGAGWFNGNDAVALTKATAELVDVIGQIGFNPGTEWGSGLTITPQNTLGRKRGVSAGDTNGSDAFDPAVEWDGFATNTFDGLGLHVSGGDAPPVVSSTSPANGDFEVAETSNITVNFSEPVVVADGWYTVSCSVSGTHTAVQTGGPQQKNLHPETDFTAPGR